MEDQHSLHQLLLRVAPESLHLFTTVLQSGIEINSISSISMGQFLNDLPGFTPDYLSDVVQTIFLNGTAIDDMTTPLTGENPVLALSAAMPGLAGAIFRRNSLHSTLRSNTRKPITDNNTSESLTVSLKLFNIIAKERGGELLQQGVCIPSISMTNFLTKRNSLMQHISGVQFDHEDIDKAELLPILSKHPKLLIQIVGTND